MDNIRASYLTALPGQVRKYHAVVHLLDSSATLAKITEICTQLRHAIQKEHDGPHTNMAWYDSAEKLEGMCKCAELRDPKAIKSAISRSMTMGNSIDSDVHEVYKMVKTKQAAIFGLQALQPNPILVVDADTCLWCAR